MKALNPKQKSFAEKYHLTGNATQSAIDSGYSNTGKSAEVMGSRLLSNDKVKAYLGTLQKQAGKKHTITRDAILDKLAGLMDDQDPKIQIKAIEVANKMCGFNEPEKQEVTGQLDVSIVYEVVGSRDEAKPKES
jgi:phage terminase small subunit